ncbi:hypothetical protein K9B35_13195 [Sphingomonas sp. R647]|uniref:hypothetical protein n=1 Tax=Sphingomonas sp. R647 TaxID=2875233 RepID=UPI001CD5859E|nr:hypothetical protein [Sphingomonas sp. R647]MCA1198926.1 hypothetical protein [Sphingomonas sp. R647]
MSMANARKHWRGLAGMAAIFVALVAMGPIFFYGIGPVFGPLVDAMGSEAMLVIAAAIAVFVLGSLAFALWAGNRADRSIGKAETNG